MGLEVAKAVVAAIGPEKVGYRISPWSIFQGMKMKDPKPQFTHIARELGNLKLAYLHIVESRIAGNATIEDAIAEDPRFLIDAFGDAGAVILAGGFTPESAEASVQNHKDRRVAIAFGRNYISNPDLPFRIAQGVGLTKYNRDTFYTPKSPVGYIDYPFDPTYVSWAAKQQSSL